MATIYIENQPYKVKDGIDLLTACLSLGFNVPYFCWHPAMHSVGACRQCAVKEFKDENDTKGRIVMSCMTPAKDGTRISIDDPQVREFRRSVIEWMMVNHPHDCPVCDEGGECHLQDMTEMTGHTYRRFRGKKRSFVNQNLGPFIAHEMNRCIQCYRCVRFYRDHARGKDLNSFLLRDIVYFGRHKDGVLESPFSGNLVEVCPTGVFTDKTLREHYTRKWDLQTAPSVCVHCSVGCNTIPGERYGKLRRIRNRYNGEVNRYFLCDRGRYGYEFVNSPLRHRTAFRRTRDENGGTEQPRTGSEILDYLSTVLHFGARVIGIGSPRASMESNFLLASMVGRDNFHAGFSRREGPLISEITGIMRNGPVRSPSLREVESADAVFLLGEDILNTAPVLALAVMQSLRNEPSKIAEKLRIDAWDANAVLEAIQDRNGPFFLAAPYQNGLEAFASEIIYDSPDNLARLGFLVAHELSPDLPEPSGTAELRPMARLIADTLKSAERPLIISGTGCGSTAVIRAAANTAWALHKTGRPAMLSYSVPECNSLGLSLLGGGSLDGAFEKIRRGEADTAIILENDLFRRADENSAADFFRKCRNTIVIDQLENETSRRADVVLPGASFAESDGTYISSEGRAQRFYQVFVPEGEVRQSWQWLLDCMEAGKHSPERKWKTFDDIVSAMASSDPLFRGLPEIAPPAGFRISGQKVPRQPRRYSGRTAMHADVTVFEPKPPEDPDSPLAFSMEGYEGKPPSSLIPRFWYPGWNSVQSVNKFQSEMGGPLHGGDPGRRLLEPAVKVDIPFFSGPPEAFSRQEGKWLIIPLYHIFGSDELSSISRGIQELAPDPYVGLGKEDAETLSIAEGEIVRIIVDKTERILPVRFLPGLAPGTAGLPSGLLRLAGIELPEWGVIAKAEVGR